MRIALTTILLSALVVVPVGSGQITRFSAGGVAGTDTQVTFNDAGAAAGDAGLTYNKTTNTLSAELVIVGASGFTGTFSSIDSGAGGGARIVNLGGMGSLYQYGNERSLRLANNMVMGYDSSDRVDMRTSGNVGPADVGARHLLGTSTTPTVADTSANSCGTGTQTIVGSDTAGKVTVIGSAGTSCTVTFGTAYTTNIPICVSTNETTAVVLKATATLTTVVLAGTFAQNDVIDYLCVGY